MIAREPRARFDASEGLIVGLTIREQVESLLKDGYFDRAESAILGVSNRDAYDLRWAGDRFDCMALTTALAARVVPKEER